MALLSHRTRHHHTWHREPWYQQDRGAGNPHDISDIFFWFCLCVFHALQGQISQGKWVNLQSAVAPTLLLFLGLLSLLPLSVNMHFEMSCVHHVFCININIKMSSYHMLSMHQHLFNDCLFTLCHFHEQLAIIIICCYWYLVNVVMAVILLDPFDCGIVIGAFKQWDNNQMHTTGNRHISVEPTLYKNGWQWEIVYHSKNMAPCLNHWATANLFMTMDNAHQQHTTWYDLTINMALVKTPGHQLGVWRHKVTTFHH